MTVGKQNKFSFLGEAKHFEIFLLFRHEEICLNCISNNDNDKKKKKVFCGFVFTKKMREIWDWSITTIMSFAIIEN